MLRSVSMPSETVSIWKVGERFNTNFKVFKGSRYLALEITNFQKEKSS